MKACSLVLVLVACNSAPQPARQGAVVVGHGAGGADGPYPMNTKEAVQAAMKAGINGIELDVQLSADGILVCYHDEQLETLTGCKGLVNGQYWIPDLERCTYRTADGHHTLMALETATNNMDSTATVILDCKLFAAGKDWSGYLDDFVSSLSDHANKLDVPKNMVIECQVTEFLDRFPGDGPFSTFYYAKAFEDGFATATAHNYDGITISADLISAEEVAQAQAQGLRVAVFGIDKASDASHLGADILEVDDL